MIQQSILVETPIGALTVTVSDRGIQKISFGKIESVEINNELPLLKDARKQLVEYFSGVRQKFSLPLDMQGTPFQLSVWRQLEKIPYGETVTYKEVAEAINNPKACRAVGNANNRNPIPIIVPCHRVIGANGRLIGYAGGLDIKRRLLELELRKTI